MFENENEITFKTRDWSICPINRFRTFGKQEILYLNLEKNEGKAVITNFFLFIIFIVSFQISDPNAN